MGLFSSSKKTKVGAAVMRVIEDKQLPNSPKTGVIKSILRNGDVSANILDEMINGVGVRADRMYEYAARGRYTYGLPSGSVRFSTDALDEVSEVLHSIEGKPVGVIYSRLTARNYMHLGWELLVSHWQYDSVSNQLRALNRDKVTVYLADMRVEVPSSMVKDLNPDVMEVWGVAPSSGYRPYARVSHDQGIMHIMRPPETIGSGTVRVPRVRVVTLEAREIRSGFFSHIQLVEVTRFLDLPIPTTVDEENDEYFHASYTVDGVRKYWSYRVGSGTYPKLDHAVESSSRMFGLYFPFLYFRYGKQSMASNTNSEAYRSSKKMAKYLGMNYGDVIESVHENPNIRDVEQAMLIMAVPANTDNPSELRYLFEYFRRLYMSEFQNSTANPSLYANQQIFRSLGSRLPRHAIIIKDKRFQFSLNFDGIQRSFVAARTGPIGTYSRVYGRETSMSVEIDSETGQHVRYYHNRPVHRYRRQITSSMCEEIRLTDLRFTYHIYGRHTDVGNEDEDILLIPIDRSVTKTFPLTVREELYARSMHYVFNSRVTVRVKWYQSGIFKAFAMVVAVVLSIYTGGQSLAMYAALAQAGMWGALFVTALYNLALSLVVMAGLKIFTKAVGGEVALIVAAVATVISLGSQFLSATSGVKGLPWAQELLQVSNGLFKAAGQYFQNAMQGIYGEYESLMEEIQAASELLEETRDLLETDSVLSPLFIVGETPAQYFQRTKYSGNVGVQSVKSISTYVKRALTLPDISDSLGGHFNAVV